MSRTIALGDIHGCSRALERILTAIAPRPDDTLIVLGDIVDRGPDTRGAIEQLRHWSTRCQVIPLIGNHEVMLFAARRTQLDLAQWLQHGGRETLASYGTDRDLEAIPREHWDFLASSLLYWEDRTAFYLHAAYEAERPLTEQEEETVLWQSLRSGIPGPHCSGRIAVVGHTPQPGGKVLNLPHLICLDTGGCYGGVLSALELASRTLWQAGQEDAGARQSVLPLPAE